VAKTLQKQLEDINVRVKFDNRDKFKPGFKFNEYELKGVPLRVAIGPKDIENKTFEIARRDTLTKAVIDDQNAITYIQDQLEQMQSDLFEKAKNFREAHITEVDDFESFKETLKTKGGFISAHWDGTAATEEAIKNSTKATIRCIPTEGAREAGICVYSGKPSQQRVLFAKAY
jgi:prolyl-tRNA synthetase